MQELVQNIYAVPGQSVGRVYIIISKDGLTLVDTSLSTKTAEKLDEQLKKVGYSLSDIQNILLTHAHPDHLGGLAGIQKRVNVRTYVHRRDAPVVRGEQPVVRPRPENLQGINRLLASMPGMPPSTPARVDVELKEGDTLDDILPGLRVVELHGHSPGQSGFWWPDKRVLIGGDVLMHFPWGLTYPLAMATVDMDEAKRSIRKVIDLAPDILCLGHGKPLVGNATEQVRAFAASHHI
jgi:glyoxylase-like metal-dependent hydrolase (beta-lactamase superfamily II)